MSIIQLAFSWLNLLVFCAFQPSFKSNHDLSFLFLFIFLTLILNLNLFSWIVYLIYSVNILLFTSFAFQCNQGFVKPSEYIPNDQFVFPFKLAAIVSIFIQTPERSAIEHDSSNLVAFIRQHQIIPFENLMPFPVQAACPKLYFGILFRIPICPNDFNPFLSHDEAAFICEGTAIPYPQLQWLFSFIPYFVFHLSFLI